MRGSFGHRALFWIRGLLYASISAFGVLGVGCGQSEREIDQAIDSWIEPISVAADKIVFFSFPVAGQAVPFVLVLLGGTSVFLTIYFRFLNFRAFGVALRTVRGRYTRKDAPGQITHFQALSAALSATVGLGNIAGVAVAIGLGGPGATFWMVVMGLLGMTTKFCECTLGVRYRKIDADGTVHGGAMYYLSAGLKDLGLGGVGRVLAVFFAIMCIGGTFGAGNMFQVNQAHDQFSASFGVLNEGWQFGLLLAFLVGLVIIGGIVWIARVTSFLVPFMCVTYVAASLVIIVSNFTDVPKAFSIILSGAFSPEAIGGGIIGVLLQGIKRAAFSNEAGLGSAPIAHSAVKTDKPASEGLVALLEPFVDTVVVCTMTALVIVMTGVWNVNADVSAGNSKLTSDAGGGALVGTLDRGSMVHISSQSPPDEGAQAEWYKVSVIESGAVGWVSAHDLTLRSGWGGGIWLTSKAFESALGWFPYILAMAVFLFAFSTMISWSYYGEQAVIYLFGRKKGVILLYKFVFCALAVVGGGASLQSVLTLSDAMVFAMVIPNLIGVYFLLPVVKKELKRFMEATKNV